MIIVYFFLGVWIIRSLLVIGSTRERYKELEGARRFSRLTVDIPPGQKPW
jgi:hypothetical protein